MYHGTAMGFAAVDANTVFVLMLCDGSGASDIAVTASTQIGGVSFVGTGGLGNDCFISMSCGCHSFGMLISADGTPVIVPAFC
jgi:hypothetical protein